MNVKRILKGGGLVLMLVVSAAVYSTYRLSEATLHTMNELRHVHEREKAYRDLLDTLRDAETGQRGYVITGNASYLEPYHGAITQMPNIRRALLESGGRTPADSDLVQSMLREADSKLAELAETVDLRRRNRLSEMYAVINSNRGKGYMDTLRRLIAEQDEQLAKNRNELNLQLERDARLASQANVGLGLLTILTVFALVALMLKTYQGQTKDKLQLQDAANTLSQQMQEVEEHNQRMQISAEMLQSLGVASSMQETSHVVAVYCQKLLPKLHGKLYLYRNSRNLLEETAGWGSPASSAALEPTDCWALRSGHSHLVTSAADLTCKHYHESDKQAWHLCVPLVVQSEVIGMLHVGAHGKPEKSYQKRVERLAEQVALALSNAQLREHLRMQSILDPLTGLYNRRYMDETLKREIVRADRKSQPLAVIAMDLDHFKRMNDTFGHEAGDLVLKQVAQCIRSSVRGSDFACRTGGEELMVGMPECNLQQALERAEVIRRAIETLELHHAGRAIGPVTISCGVAVYPAQGGTGDDLLGRADAALYKAKEQGRNRVVAVVDTMHA